MVLSPTAQALELSSGLAVLESKGDTVNDTNPGPKLQELWCYRIHGVMQDLYLQEHGTRLKLLERGSHRLQIRSSGPRLIWEFAHKRGLKVPRGGGPNIDAYCRLVEGIPSWVAVQDLNLQLLQIRKL